MSAAGTLPPIGAAGEEVRHLAERRAEPDWLVKRRLEAWAVFEATPMPDPLRDEDWRRMSFAGLDLERRPAAGEDPLDVTLDGAPLPAGVVAAPIAGALRVAPDLVRDHLATRALPAARGKFEALSAALFSSGAFIYVPKGVEVPGTIVVRGKAAPAAGANSAGFGAFRRSVVVLDRDASATVMAIDESEDAEGVKVAAVEVYLADGARLRHATLQVLGGSVFSFETRRALVGRDARVEWVTCDLGARLSRTVCESDLAAPGGRSEACSMVFGNARQHLDLAVRMIHDAPHTESDMVVRAALAGSARAVYRGHVDIRRGARGTDSQQKEAVLLLSDEARSDAIPSLFIDENDVRAGHGATAGRVNDEHLFYLMSRGLGRRAAERLIIEGFFAPLLERIAVPALRDEMLLRIDRKIEA